MKFSWLLIFILDSSEITGFLQSQNEKRFRDHNDLNHLDSTFC